MNSNTPHTVIPNATTATTVRAMKKLANEGKQNLDVRRKVEEICSGLASGDYTSEVLAIYYWVTSNIRYVRDPDDVEMVKTADQILKTGTGDCDDLAILLAAMCMAAGNPCDFVLVGFHPGSLSHVYCAVRTPWGRMVLDPVANRITKRMLGDVKNIKVVPVTSGPGVMDAGIGNLPHVAANGGNLYSVYDYHTGKFDYYEAPAKPVPATGQYRKPRKVQSLGIVPEEFAAALPSNARKIGSGTQARGMIATRVGGFDFKPNKDIIIGALFGAALMRVFMSRKS